MAIGPRFEIAPRATLRIGPGLVQAIGLLSLRNADLAADLARAARGNPFLRLAGAGADPETLAAMPSGLHAHVLTEIGFLALTPDEWRIAQAFLEALAPSGWLDATIEEVATRAGVPTARTEAVLKRLQQIAPSGLFARSLVECLELQARDRGLLTDEVAAILRSLGAIADGGISALAEASGLSIETVDAALAVLRTLDPKPGAGFAAADQSLLRAPDFVATRIGHGTEQGWRVELNAATLPGIEALGCDDDAPPTLRRAAQEARSLARAVARRNSTLLAVGRALVRRQCAYLKMEVPDPAPLVRAEIAGMAGVHESTVSRVAQAMTMQTPRGVIGLASLFSRPVSGGGCSVSALRARIGSIIAAEPCARPLSDAAIADRLAADGIAVARRSVARHREHLDIPARAVRRRTGPQRPA
jgi:RNA polymerase sigma-54 factor